MGEVILLVDVVSFVTFKQPSTLAGDEAHHWYLHCKFIPLLIQE